MDCAPLISTHTSIAYFKMDEFYTNLDNDCKLNTDKYLSI